MVPLWQQRYQENTRALADGREPQLIRLQQLTSKVVGKSFGRFVIVAILSY